MFKVALLFVVCSVYVTWWATQAGCGLRRWMAAPSSAGPQTAHSKCGMPTLGCVGTRCTATPPLCAACRCVETSESCSAHSRPSFCPSSCNSVSWSHRIHTHSGSAVIFLVFFFYCPIIHSSFRGCLFQLFCPATFRAQLALWPLPAKVHWGDIIGRLPLKETLRQNKSFWWYSVMPNPVQHTQNTICCTAYWPVFAKSGSIKIDDDLPLDKI